MRKEILALVASAVALVTLVARGQVGAIDPFDYRSGQAPNRPHSSHEYGQGSGGTGEHEKRQKYTCPMHPEVNTDHPGNCPKCGMKLVPVTEKKRSTPINREQAPNSDKSRAGVERPTPNLLN